MQVLSVPCSHSFPSLLLPPNPSPKINGRLSSPTILIPVSSLKSSCFPSRFAVNGNWDLRRNRFPANSADPERDFQFPTQVSPGNEEISKQSGSNPSTSFLSVLCPLLKLFSGGDPAQERNYFLEVATSSLSTLARLPWGSRSQISAVDPPNHLQLFEFVIEDMLRHIATVEPLVIHFTDMDDFCVLICKDNLLFKALSTEACPFCRRVREAITELDLSVEIYPCPKGSIRHREMVRNVGGKEQFPFLVDPNTGISMYESGDIVKYLFQQYGKGRSPSIGLLESTLLTGWMPTILRAGRGMSLWEKTRTELPPKKLELFSYENNPYARIVREALCELELPYILQTVGEGSQRTNLLVEASGSKEVPYIIDPNTGTQLGDYKKILSYLFQTYAMVTA